MPQAARNIFYMFLAASFLALATPFFASPSSAQDMPFAAKDALEGSKKQNAIQAVETYLNDLTTFAARFEQTVAGTAPSSGTFLFKKPGRFLWHYLTPDAAKLVSSGGTIYFHDETSNQTTQVPRKGLADLLTRFRIDLTNDEFSVREAFIKGGLLYLTVAIDDVAEGDIGGSLELTFMQDPLQLRQITTINQMGQPVEVMFFNIRENETIPDDVFKFVPFHYRER